MNEALTLFALVTVQMVAPPQMAAPLPPYQLAGAYWTPPTSVAQSTIPGDVRQPEYRMFVIASATQR